MQAGSQGFESPCLQSRKAWRQLQQAGNIIGCTSGSVIPLPPVYARSGSGERRLSRRNFSEGGLFFDVAQFRASFDSASPRMNAFTYVYILQSENHPDRFYIGRTADLRNRITLHNAGRIRHTVKWKPWHLKSYIALSDTNRAIALEHYLKSSSGRAFAKKRL